MTCNSDNPAAHLNDGYHVYTRWPGSPSALLLLHPSLAAPVHALPQSDQPCSASPLNPYTSAPQKLAPANLRALYLRRYQESMKSGHRSRFTGPVTSTLQRAQKRHQQHTYPVTIGRAWAASPLFLVRDQDLPFGASIAPKIRCSGPGGRQEERDSSVRTTSDHLKGRYYERSLVLSSHYG